MRNSGRLSHFLEPQCLLGAVQISQAETGGTDLRKNRLSLRGMSRGQLLVLNQGTLKVAPFLSDTAEVQPSARRHLLPARVKEIFVILPGRFPLLRLEMQLAELARRFLISWDVACPPMNCLQDM